MFSLLIMALPLKASDFQYAAPPRNNKEVLTGLNCYSCKRPAYEGFIHTLCGSIRCGNCELNHLCKEGSYISEQQNWISISSLPEAMRSGLDTIQVVCPFEKCKFIGTRASLLEHKNNCEYAPLVCFNCSSSMPRAKYNAHLRQCVPTPCPYCSKTVLPAELKEHELDVSKCLNTTELFKTLKHPQVIHFLQEVLLVSPPILRVRMTKKRKPESAEPSEQEEESAMEEEEEESIEEEEEEKDEEDEKLKQKVMESMGTREMKKTLSANKIKVPKDSNKDAMADIIVEAVKSKRMKLFDEVVEDMTNEQIIEKLLGYQYDHLTQFVRSQGLSLTATGMNKQKLAQHMVQQYRSSQLNLKLLFAKPVVHTILEHRGEEGNYEYFVDWKDLDQPSWEHESVVDTAAVRNYWAELAR